MESYMIPLGLLDSLGSYTTPLGRFRTLKSNWSNSSNLGSHSVNFELMLWNFQIRVSEPYSSQRKAGQVSGTGANREPTEWVLYTNHFEKGLELWTGMTGNPSSFSIPATLNKEKTKRKEIKTC